MAILLILLALVFLGVGSGSTASGSASAPALREQPAHESLRAKNTSCVVVTWAKGTTAQQRACRRPPAKP